MVGSYLIIIGLVNANDLVGYAFRLEGYFVKLDLDILVSTSVLQAGIFSLVTMGLGAMLLLGQKVRLTLLLISLFDLFHLIFIIFLSNQNGENIWDNFFVQLILLILSLYQLMNWNKIKPLFSPIKQKVILTTFVLIVAVIPIYSYSFLPIIDFGNYRVGMDIKDTIGMQNRNFNCFDMDGNNSTKEVLDYRENQFFLVVEDIKTCNSNAVSNFNQLASEVEKLGIPFYGIASNNSSEIEDFRHEVQAAYPFLRADRDVLKSMIRSNPGLILLDGSTIVAKWHFNSIPKINALQSEFKIRSGGPSIIQ